MLSAPALGVGLTARALPVLQQRIFASRPVLIGASAVLKRLCATPATASSPTTTGVSYLSRPELPSHLTQATSPRSPEPLPGDSLVDVEAYVSANITPYDGNDAFLEGPTANTLAVREKVAELVAREMQCPGCTLDVDTHTPSDINAFAPGYIDKDHETIVGFQTDLPGKRAMKLRGGWRMVKTALEAYGYEMDKKVEEIFSKHVKTHNEGVFDTYTEDMRNARKSAILTGLPDAYGRGRIIGDYRRVALYGVDYLIEVKTKDKDALGPIMSEDVMRLRGEVSDQIRALQDLKKMAQGYGIDISRPAATAQEAVQWLYFGYLGAVKEQDGAAMSLGRVDGFLDTYFERDLAAGRITEAQAQEYIDQLVLKLRMVKFLRTPEYNELFSGDPTWVTAAIGGVREDGKGHLVTKTSFRILQTLANLNPAPEPNMSVLWSRNLPQGFKDFCAQMSIKTCAIQYLSDDLMGATFGHDYGIACCVSAMRVGKDMQFFGARCNLPKLMLYTLNQGRDEISGELIAKDLPAYPLDESKPLEYDTMLAYYDKSMDWLAQLYTQTLNTIHYNHDKLNYEKIQMALHDTHVRRFLAMGVAGLSIVADSLSAIKYAKVYPIKDERGLVTDFRIEGDFPVYGNDDPRVDDIADKIVATFNRKLCAQPTYRNSIPTLSILTITSNVVYGKKTGNTPDGRKRGEPFAPGANPYHGRDLKGAVTAMNSVASLPYEHALDGISYTFSITPTTLGKDLASRTKVMTGLLDGYFEQTGHHININVLSRDTLVDAMHHPEKYPNLTIRVSGYAVHFTKLPRAMQEEVIARTLHESL